jgi:hypothetical protein
MSLKLFALLTKVDEAKREVIGRAVQEVPDRADEIFDYVTSKPYFEEWSKSFADDTAGKSLGNLRAMHGRVAAGKLTAIDFNDADKAIDIRAKVVDDAEWKKVLEGVYTGFSIGGSYVGDKKTEKLEGGREVKRYTAQPSEISLVDSPCIPSAKFFEVVKTDGAIAKVAFRPPEYEIKGTDEEVGAFAKLLNDAGLAIADAITAVKAHVAKVAITTKAAAIAKSMWNVQDFASVLSSIASLARSEKWDAAYEGDDSPIPAALRTWLADGIAIFKTMAEEELSEMLAEFGGADEIEAAARVGDLKKRLADPDLPFTEFAKLAAQHLTADELKPLKNDTTQITAAIITKASVKLTTANKDRLQAAHDHLAAIGATCGKEAASATGGLAKAHSDELASVRAELVTARKDIDMLKAQPVPYVTLRTTTLRKGDEPVAHAADPTTPVDPAAVLLTKDDYIYNADRTVDWSTSRAVKARKLALAAPAAASL